ncbi:MAG: HAD family hydrolase [Clostridia bacterium]|nr:HAD family hydrolase [Clostridia bacterium]
MNKLVIFDFDGTLCDTLPDIVYFANQTLKNAGYEAKPSQQIRDTVCLSIAEIFSLLTGEKQNSQIVKDAVAYYQKSIKESKSPRTVLYDGISELLASLKQNGCKIAILTNKAQDEMQVIYDRLFSEYAFDEAIGLRQGIAIKPDPTEIFNLMKKFGVDKENTYFVGDGDTDVLAALNAGVNLIAVTYGYRDKDYLQKLGARNFANTPSEILKYILD